MTKEALVKCPIYGCGREALAGQLQEPHTVLGTVFPCTGVLIYRHRFMPDDVRDGDTGPRDSTPEVHKLTTEVMLVEQVVSLLDSEGLTEFSSWPDFQPHGWYSQADGSVIVNHATGEREEVSAHLYGLTLSERNEVFAKVTRR